MGRDATLQALPPEHRLRSWKEIASAFGIDVRTAKRWEQARAMPVHRPPGDRRGAVYAYAGELVAWFGRDHAVEAAPEAVVAPLAAAIVAPTPVPTVAGPRWRVPLLAAAALAALGLSLGIAWQHPGSTAIARGSTDRAYLTGLYHLGTRTADGMALAGRYFQEAIAREPGNAGAYAGLAEAFAMQAQFAGLPADEADAQATMLARRALAIDPAQPRALALLGFLAWHDRHDMAGAEALFRRALQADPAAAYAHGWYAMVAMHRGGDQRVALREIDTAQALDPGSRTILANRALILFHAGRAAEAEVLLRQLAQAEPGLRSPPEYLATLYGAAGRWDDWLLWAGRAAAIGGDADARAIVAAAGQGWRAGGRTGLLTARLAAEHAAFARGRWPAFKVAQTEALLGKDDAAMATLRGAVDHGEPDVVGLLLEPALAPLRGRGDFKALAKRVGLIA